MAKEKEEKAKKKLAVMNLLEDFLFGVVVTYPGIGERFVRLLLRIIFGKEFGRVSVTAQKPFYGEDTNLRGARLDVYLEPEIEADAEERATVYDVEPDKNDKPKDIRALPRRMRFYHGKIIAKELNAGADFDELKNVVILMIVPYDPFGLDRMMYTIENKCKEVPDMPYDDGASTIFLYTGGTTGVPSEEVKQLLGYMVKTTYDNAVNDDLKEMHKMVETVKNDPDTSLEYWKWQDRQIRMKREAEAEGFAKGETEGFVKGEAEGFAKGKAKGIIEGKAEGKAEGRSEGKAEGDMKRLITQVCKKIEKNKTLEETAGEVEEEISFVEPIYNAVKESAPPYDMNIIYQKIYRSNC